MLQAATIGSTTEEETKQILLARIKTSMNSQSKATKKKFSIQFGFTGASGHYAHERQSKILNANEGGYLLEVLPSEAQLNKLQKRSLQELLNEKP